MKSPTAGPMLCNLTPPIVVQGASISIELGENPDSVRSIGCTAALYRFLQMEAQQAKHRGHQVDENGWFNLGRLMVSRLCCVL